MEIDLKNLLLNKSFSRKEKVLAILAAENLSVKPVAAIRELGLKNGLRTIKDWNLSQVLANLSDAVARFPDGWGITEQGRAILKELGIEQATPSKKFQPSLRKYAKSITDHTLKTFIDEAIDAIEFKLFRSAVVLSWIGALSILYEYVYSNHLTAFNAEAVKRFPKWKPATNRDDLPRMKEYDFIQVITAISVIGKSTKDELEQCLKLRNACGHPNNFVVGENRVASHVETLILNVFSKFSI